MPYRFVGAELLATTAASGNNNGDDNKGCVRPSRIQSTQVTEVQRGREDAVREIHPGQVAEAQEVQVNEKN